MHSLSELIQPAGAWSDASESGETQLKQLSWGRLNQKETTA